MGTFSFTTNFRDVFQCEKPLDYNRFPIHSFLNLNYVKLNDKLEMRFHRFLRGI